MKKALFLLAAASVMLASCAKNEFKPAPETNGTTFSASFAEDTRTALQSDGKVYWATGDSIKITWDGGAVSAYASSEGATTTFMAEIGTASKYYAVYPALTTTLPTEAEAEYDFKITIPKTQHGTFAEANFAVASTDPANKNFAFKNLCALVKFTISRNDIKEVRFRPSPDTKIVGTKSVKIGTDGTPSIIGAEGNVEAIVTPATGSVFAPGVYYLGVAPVTCSNGFSFKVKKSDDTQLPFKTYSGSVTLTRSQAIDFGVIDDTEIISDKDFYVTVAGAGDKSGHSWANALGVSELRTVLKNGTDLNGVKVYMAGGEYEIADATAMNLTLSYASGVTTTFLGGYNATTGARDIASNSTIFTGNSTSAIFMFTDNVNFTFSGIVFANSAAQAATPDARAITLNASTAIVHLDSCKFTGNVENVAKGGPALFVKSGKAYVNGCIFAYNVAKSQGGAIRVDGTSAVLMMNNCKFWNNSIGSSATYGTVAFLKGNVGINGCTFYGNNEQEGVNQPVLNINNNIILTNNTIFGASNYSSGTGLIRAENTGDYHAYFINNKLVNTYSGSNKAFGLLYTKSDKKVEGNHNLYCAKDGGIGDTSKYDVAETDANKTALGQTYQFNTTTLEVTFDGAIPGYSEATQADVKSQVEKITFTKDVTTLGADFAAWLTAIGVF